MLIYICIFFCSYLILKGLISHLKYMDINYDETRCLLSVITNKLETINECICAKSIREALNSIQNMTSNYQEVQALLKVISYHIDKVYKHYIYIYIYSIILFTARTILN